MPRTFEVWIEATVRIKEEVVAPNGEHAEDLALNGYTLDGAVVIDEEVIDVVEITSYREPATI